MVTSWEASAGRTPPQRLALRAATELWDLGDGNTSIDGRPSNKIFRQGLGADQRQRGGHRTDSLERNAHPVRGKAVVSVGGKQPRFPGASAS